MTYEEYLAELDPKWSKFEMEGGTPDAPWSKRVMLWGGVEVTIMEFAGVVQTKITMPAIPTPEPEIPDQTSRLDAMRAVGAVFSALENQFLQGASTAHHLANHFNGIAGSIETKSKKGKRT
jgi:hypothetical protein